MIYDVRNRWAFVHIPRTGGMSLTAALVDAFPSAHVDTWEGRHRTAEDLSRELPEWSSLFSFAVVRSPWEVIASDYRLCLSAARAMEDDDYFHGTAEWRLKLVRTIRYGCFEQFVRAEWLGEFSPLVPGGFWPTWCCDSNGRQIVSTVYQSDRMAEAWEEIQERLGFRGQLPRLNAAPPVEIDWPVDLASAVGALCWIDVERFGWRPVARFR